MVVNLTLAAHADEVLLFLKYNFLAALSSGGILGFGAIVCTSPVCGM